MHVHHQEEQVFHMGARILGGAVKNLYIEDSDSDTDDVLLTGLTSGYGLLIVRELAGGLSGVFRIENQTIVSVSANVAFSITKDNAATFNVYFETDQFKVQNKVGNNKKIGVAFFGVI